MVRPCHFNFYFWYQIDLTYTLQDGMDCLQSCLTDLPTEAIFYLLERAAAGCLIVWVLLWVSWQPWVPAIYTAAVFGGTGEGG